MPIVLVVLSLLTLSMLFASLLANEEGPDIDAEDPEPPRARRTEWMQGRILFVARRGDHLVLDCVAGSCQPARCSLAPGTPFALTVEAVGPPWFADAVEAMVARWAEEDAVVELLVVVGPEGERVDVHRDRSRVRLDVRASAGLG